MPGSGGDYAYWRGDDVAALDARYLLEEDGRHGDHAAEPRLPVGPQARHDAAAARRGRSRAASRCRTTNITCAARPRSNAPPGKHDWLTKHVFIGVGERRADGNLLRYYALT